MSTLSIDKEKIINCILYGLSSEGDKWINVLEKFVNPSPEQSLKIRDDLVEKIIYYLPQISEDEEDWYNVKLGLLNSNVNCDIKPTSDKGEKLMRGILDPIEIDVVEKWIISNPDSSIGEVIEYLPEDIFPRIYVNVLDIEQLLTLYNYYQDICGTELP